MQVKALVSMVLVQDLWVVAFSISLFIVIFCWNVVITGRPTVLLNKCSFNIITTAYNLILLYFVQIALALAIGSSFSWLLASLTYPIMVGFLQFPYILALPDAPGPSYVFPVLLLEWTISLRSPGSFLLEKDIRYQDMGWDVLIVTGVSGPLRWQSKEMHVCILTCEYIHISKYFHM